MGPKVYIYIVTTLLSAYTLTGINFNKFWNTKKQQKQEYLLYCLV